MTDAIEEAWDSEIRRRIERFQSGSSGSFAAEQVWAEVEAALES